MIDNPVDVAEGSLWIPNDFYDDEPAPPPAPSSEPVEASRTSTPAITTTCSIVKKAAKRKMREEAHVQNEDSYHSNDHVPAHASQVEYYSGADDVYLFREPISLLYYCLCSCS